MGQHKLKSSLDSLVPYEVAEAQRAVQFLEGLLRKEEKATSPLVSKAATAALLAASELVEANGVKLSFSPVGITWRLEKKEAKTDAGAEENQKREDAGQEAGQGPLLDEREPVPEEGAAPG